MKSWLLDNFTGIDHLRLADVPDPTPRDGEVLLKVHYAALNPADRYLAERLYPADPPLPHILGRDCVGTVAALGRGVQGLSVGDKRMLLRGEAGVNRPGTFAQYVVVPAENLVPIPDGWTDQQAAGATLVYLTAHIALTLWGPLAPSSVILISGASGGVGVASVQLAAAMGFSVIALSRSEEKRRRLEKLGAALVLDPADPKWRHALKSFLNPRRVDLAIDNIGGALLPQMIDTLADQGKVSLVGRLAGPVPSFNTASLFFRRIRLGGVALGALTAAESRAAWNEVLTLLARTGAQPLVDRVFSFDHLPQAFARLAEGPMGKVLLQVP